MTNPTDPLPTHHDLFYNGTWHLPQGQYRETFNPGNGQIITKVAQAGASDVDTAVQ